MDSGRESSGASTRMLCAAGPFARVAPTVVISRWEIWARAQQRRPVGEARSPTGRSFVGTLWVAAWIAERHNLILVGPTGIGKSFLSCAWVERACRRGFTARYVRMPRLLHELAVGRGDGSYTRLLARLAKLDLLAIDDWMLAPLRDPERRDLTEVIEDRAERASTLIASQLPVTDWHAVIGDPNQADAICDRLLHDAHRIELKGRSMRRTHDAPKTPST